MPVILNPSDFPSAPKEGRDNQDNQDTQDTQDKQLPKASDFIYKGPQIPNNKDDLPPKASREDIEARMKQLNNPSE